MQGRNIAVIDFETTGLSPWAGARAIEIGGAIISLAFAWAHLKSASLSLAPMGKAVIPTI